MFNGNLHTKVGCTNCTDPMHCVLPATVRIRNVRTWHPGRTLSYLLNIMCTLFQNREQKKSWMPRAVCAPYFCTEIPIEHYLINSIPNCLRHHVVPPLIWAGSQAIVSCDVLGPVDLLLIIIANFNYYTHMI